MLDMSMRSIEPRASAPDQEQKRAALTYLHEAWVEARIDGIDGDCLAQACLFAAFADNGLVGCRFFHSKYLLKESLRELVGVAEAQ